MNKIINFITFVLTFVFVISSVLLGKALLTESILLGLIVIVASLGILIFKITLYFCKVNYY